MGKTILSCGHVMPEDLPLEATEVRYADESCDAVDGFHRVVVSANFCIPCQQQPWFREVVLGTDAEADAWLAGGREEPQAA